MKCLHAYDKTKQICVVLLLLEATHCCRESLQRPAFPSGSLEPCRFFSYSVICYSKYFASVWDKIHKMSA